MNGPYTTNTYYHIVLEVALPNYSTATYHLTNSGRFVALGSTEGNGLRTLRTEEEARKWYDSVVPVLEFIIRTLFLNEIVENFTSIHRGAKLIIRKSYSVVEDIESTSVPELDYFTLNPEKK